MENQEKKFVRKPVRSVSGVTPLTVVLEPRKCDHGTCIYCPGGDFVPQSYTNKSPAIMRALALQFDPYEQVKNRLGVLDKMNHQTDKIELIVLGGTFLQYPLEYQYNFIKRCYDALNDCDSKNLKEAKKINETAKHRCVAMCIENRPDNCSKEEIERMLEFGCTRVEIGVQMPDDELYRKTNRGHTVKEVIEATKNLKDAGFKLGYHIMPGLPYSNPKKDIELFKKIFDNPDFRPDQLKIYPCQVVEDSPLAKTYKLIKFTPYSEKQTQEILIKMMKIIPEYCRVMRMMREFPKEKLIEGLERLDIRKEIENDFRKNKEQINEIRMREVGFNKDINQNVKLKTIEYEASGGKELFLEFINDDNILFGLLRLRIFDSENQLSSIENKSAKHMSNRAMVRELHVYGQALNIGIKSKINDSQHRGIGKILMEEAEKIAKEYGMEELYVISGIGVREYYKKLGYKIKEPYMVKKLL
ncbi:MAG: tRNA uridine(34) 5-carboxymethylaminomethyl modification radical SAM/GNAT enzyme Elp3 [Candidatus Pacearchaeota archaeon]